MSTKAKAAVKITPANLGAVIDKVGMLNHEAKVIKEEVDGIKEDLTDFVLAAGITKESGEHYKMTASIQDVFDGISPSDVQASLAKFGLEDKLLSVLTVSMTELKKVLPASEIDKLKGKAVATKISFRFTEVK